jgi:hypothetical protein
VKIASNLRLDPDYVGGGTFALLAKKGAGKTYTGRVMAEEMWTARIPFVVLDPMGAWWGLRASADGKKPGIPVAVFGGDRGDAPLERTAGKVLADLVVDERLSMVIDMKALGSRAAERQFATDFLERLYRRNSELVHLFVDEADLFAPQKPQAGDQGLLGVTENIVRRGRNAGIGITLITQRPAVLNKDVLTQVDGLVAMRITGLTDRQAIDEWVRGHDDPELASEVKPTLAGLANGECWWWIPELGVLERVQVRRSRTFDSSPTRTRGETRRPPKTFADIDMAAIEAKMADTIERARAADPRELSRRIKELEAALEARPAAEPEQVPVLTDDARAALERAAGAIDEAQQRMVDAIATASGELGAIMDRIAAARKAAPAAPSPAPPRRQPPPRRDPAPPARGGTHQDGDAGAALPKAPQTLLDTLVAHTPRRLTKAELSTLSGYKPRSSTYRNALSALRVAGYLDETGGLFSPSPEGFEHAGADATVAPQTTEQLLDIWYRALGLASRRMLEALVAAHPDPVDRDDLAEQTGYSLTSSTYRNAISALRINGLLEDLPDGAYRASDGLFLGATT